MVFNTRTGIKAGGYTIFGYSVSITGRLSNCKELIVEKVNRQVVSCSL